MSRDSALLVGATGLVGRHLLPLLLEESTYKSVVAIGRKELPLTHEKLSQHVVDFERLGSAAKWIRAGDVYCCLGTTIRKAGSQAAFRKVDYTYPYEIAKIAKVNGARQFLIITAVGADPASSVFYSRVKGEIEQTIGKMPFDAVHIFRPSVLIGAREEFRFGERLALAARVLSFAMVGRWRKYRPIAASTVARAMVRAAREGRHGINIHEFDRILAMSQEA
jgi:uncharacterized protein YbjT (DUF2867 family)